MPPGLNLIITLLEYMNLEWKTCKEFRKRRHSLGFSECLSYTYVGRKYMFFNLPGILYCFFLSSGLDDLTPWFWYNKRIL